MEHQQGRLPLWFLLAAIRRRRVEITEQLELIKVEDDRLRGDEAFMVWSKEFEA